MKSPAHLPQNTWNDGFIESYKRNLNENITDECADHCLENGKHIMAIDSGAICRCGHTLPIKPRSSFEEFCQKCTDQSGLTCGNVYYGFMSVYRINENS